MPLHDVEIPTEALAEFCRRNHVARLVTFGSLLRDDFGPDSDVDLLVEFKPAKVPGLRFFGLGGELSELLGREVDLNTPECLSRYFRDRVVGEAKGLYEAE